MASVPCLFVAVAPCLQGNYYQPPQAKTAMILSKVISNYPSIIVKPKKILYIYSRNCTF